MKKVFHLTKGGVKELEAELSGLLARRGPIAERIRTAREFGDLSENAEYSSARQEQERIETRIAEIENILKNVSLIQKPQSEGKVQLGSTVHLRDSRGRTKQFQVVGTIEADPLGGKISDESPIGRALLGKKPGDEIQLKSPAEAVIYAIIDIT